MADVKYVLLADIVGDIIVKTTVKSRKLNQWYQSSQAVACMMNTGCFAYVEEKVCLDEPKYVERQESGKMRLTPYAKEHEEECFLQFKVDADGISVFTAAFTMAFYSLDYSMSNFDQAKARIHRVGQRENCHYIYLIARGTVDRKILRSLRDKINLAKTLVDDYRQGRNPFRV